MEGSPQPFSTQIEALKKLIHLKHGHILPFQHIYVDQHRVVTIHRTSSAPRLLPLLCQQNEVLTENIVAKIAYQLLDICLYLKSLGISHGSLDIENLQVTKFDLATDDISIKIDGLE